MSMAVNPGAAGARKPFYRRLAFRKGLHFYLAISPWLVGFILMSLVPLIIGLLTSFTNYDGFDTGFKWVGWFNYKWLFTMDKDAWWGLYRTALLTIVAVPLGSIGGFALATLLNQKVRGMGLFRTVFYIPSIVPVVVTALMFRFIYDRDGGPLNAVISLFAPGKALAWLSNDWCTPSLIMMMLWGLGGGVVIYLAGLQGIPAELKEVAAIDGASTWQSFRHITIPLMTPVLFFQLVMGIIRTLQTFSEPLLLTPLVSGGTFMGAVPPRNNFLFVNQAFNQIFAYNRFGYGTAMLWVLFLVVLLFTLLIFKSSSFWVYYEVDQEGKEK
ncbi:MAG: carbohydrate ABC transporter permease [Bacteroidota bacterium]